MFSYHRRHLVTTSEAVLKTTSLEATDFRRSLIKSRICKIDSDRKDRSSAKQRFGVCVCVRVCVCV